MQNLGPCCHPSVGFWIYSGTPKGNKSYTYAKRQTQFASPYVSGTSNDPIPYLLSHYPPQAPDNCNSLVVLDKLIININIEINIKHTT